MKLNLRILIVFFDLETTGTNINTDRIVEICYLKGVSKRQRRNEDHAYQSGNAYSRTIFCHPRYL